MAKKKKTKKKKIKRRYFEQTVGKGKGRKVKLVTSEGNRVAVKDLKTKFIYYVSVPNFEKHYKEYTPKKKGEKKCQE